MRPLRALLLGAVAGAVVGYVTAAALGVLLAAARTDLVLAVGPLVFVAVEQGADGSETTFGTGLLLVPFACGVANAVAAAVLAARSGSGPMA